MNTQFLLMAQYSGQAVIPVERICADYFRHLSPAKFLEKCGRGDIKLPLLRMEAKSQKSAKGVHLQDLAEYLDARRAAAVKEAALIAKATNGTTEISMWGEIR